MLTQRQIFFQHLALPSRSLTALEIEKANGIYIYDVDGKEYIDLVSGVSVSNLGHQHPKIIEAIKSQVDKYIHLMVYGKYIQSPQVQLAKMLSDNLPDNLNSTYLVNSGSEAVEGALKLAKRYTGRTEIIAFKNAYHGGTQGALSVLGNETLKYAFRPLLPDIRFLSFNDFEDLNHITEKTACVIIEPIQAEAGIILPKDNYLKSLREKCNQTGTLLIFDEVQVGFGRTGKLFCFEHYCLSPDILVIAKAMGGGMPIGAFISSKKIMSTLTCNPELGHITTFGGHPVSCAAALANLKVLCEENYIETAPVKEKLFTELIIKHPLVKSIRSKGLFMAVELPNAETNKKVIERFLKNGIVVDCFLFRHDSFRIAPPLIISEKEVRKTAILILKTLDEVMS